MPRVAGLIYANKLLNIGMLNVTLGWHGTCSPTHELRFIARKVRPTGAGMNIRSLMRHTVLISGLCALLGVPTLAYSGAVFLVGDGYQNGSESFTLTATPPPAVNPVGAGGFAGRIGPNPGPNPPTTPMIFWCVELTQTFGFGTVYSDYTYSSLGNTLLSQLFTEVGGSASATSTTDRSAAFQLAIWEILFEGATYGGLNVSSGNFQATGNAAAITQANTWLAGLSLGSPATTALFLISSPNHQDFITDTNSPLLLTPEPGSLALLGIGILAAMFAMRRRTQGASR
jgi:hypothetical protein